MHTRRTSVALSVSLSDWAVRRRLSTSFCGHDIRPAATHNERMSECGEMGWRVPAVTLTFDAVSFICNSATCPSSRCLLASSSAI